MKEKCNVSLREVTPPAPAGDERQSLIADAKRIIEAGRRTAYAAAGRAVLETNWRLGQRIVEEEQEGAARAQYGKQVIEMLAKELTVTYGSGYSARNLRNFRRFYLCFRDMDIWNTRVPNLDWSHIRRILSVENPDARRWYLKEASEAMWSYRTLDRNIATQYYERRLAAQREGLSLPAPEGGADEPLEYIKNPIVAEFLGFRKDTKFDETVLEEALITNLRQFIMELGRGFAFVERQKHVSTDAGDYYIDLVFYNIQLHCYVLIDLKTHQITHQDVGQMDMYIRMFDDLVRGEGDNPTIGIVLCSETSKDIARYSILHDSRQLFAAKYMTVMPTEEELRREIEQQKRFFMEQHTPESLNPQSH